VEVKNIVNQRKMTKILIGCEESQAVCIAFRELGLEAYSCDILPCSGGHPEWHIQSDILEVLKDDIFSLKITFQPCTDLSLSGAKWFEQKRSSGVQEKSIRFFFEVWKKSNCSENPMGILNGGKYIKKWYPGLYEEMVCCGFPFKPTQVIQPYMFGDEATKTTCLWLNGLPPLTPTCLVSPGEFCGKDRVPKWYAVAKGNRSITRSKTFQGIANAMAEQWSKLI
jgi:hypothetical protein